MATSAATPIATVPMSSVIRRGEARSSRSAMRSANGSPVTRPCPRRPCRRPDE
jgi:hypothetical protein